MAFFVFILGLFIGSFLNVLADRLPNDQTILGRSHCDYCRKTLKWFDLIPVISYMSTNGRCRYCHKKLSIQYPLSELATAFLFLVTYVIVLNSKLLILKWSLVDSMWVWNLVYLLTVVSAFIVIFFADLRHRIIPDKILFPTVFLVFADLFINHQDELVNHLVASGACFLFFLFIFLFTKGRGMGFGDVKLAFLIGLLLGIPLSFVALYIAFLTGAGVAIILVLWRKRGLKSEISFGPFMVLGTFFAFFLQPELSLLIHKVF